MHDSGPTVSPYNGHMLRNLSKYYLFICCNQGSSTHFCHYLATAFVADVLAGSNPMRWAQKRKAPIAGSLSNQWWVMRDVRVRLRRPLPLRACGPRVLRWKTLTRFLSSAPWRVRIPLHWAKKERPPSLGAFSIKWWAMRDSNPQPCACKAPALTVAPIARAERV